LKHDNVNIYLVLDKSQSIKALRTESLGIIPLSIRAKLNEVKIQLVPRSKHSRFRLQKPVS